MKNKPIDAVIKMNHDKVLLRSSHVHNHFKSYLSNTFRSSKNLSPINSCKEYHETYDNAYQLRDMTDVKTDLVCIKGDVVKDFYKSSVINSSYTIKSSINIKQSLQFYGKHHSFDLMKNVVDVCSAGLWCLLDNDGFFYIDKDTNIIESTVDMMIREHITLEHIYAIVAMNHSRGRK